MLTFLLFALIAHSDSTWPIKGATSPTAIVSPEKLFTPAEKGWGNGLIKIEPKRLGRQAHDALRYIDENSHLDQAGVQPGMFVKMGVDLKTVETALTIVAATAKTHPSHLTSAKWWESNFDLLRWNPSVTSASMANGNQIRLTKYLIYEYTACRQKTSACPHALWSLPKAEMGLANASSKEASLPASPCVG